MRISALAAMAVALATPVYAQVSPCVVADASCKESLPAVGQKNFWYFRSYPLQTYNADITRAVIVMHGNARNAPDYFDAVVSALYQDPSFDRSCPANAEGSHLADDGSGLVGGRRERGTIFWNYMQQLGANHTLNVVPTCDHNEFCMYSAIETIQAILF